MKILLILCGIALIGIGLYQKKNNSKFENYIEAAIEESNSVESAINDIIERLDVIETKMKENSQSVFGDSEKLIKLLDFENKTVDELAQSTGIKKGEVLLLKRILKG